MQSQMMALLGISNVELPPFTNRCLYVYLEHTHCQVKVQFPRFVCPEGDSTMLKVGKIIFSFPWLSLISGIALSREVFDVNGNRIFRTAMDSHTLKQKENLDICISIFIFKRVHFQTSNTHIRAFHTGFAPPPPGAVVELTHINLPTLEIRFPSPIGVGQSCEQISGKIWHNRGFNDKSVKTSKIVHLDLLNKIGYGPIA